MMLRKLTFPLLCFIWICTNQTYAQNFVNGNFSAPGGGGGCNAGTGWTASTGGAAPQYTDITSVGNYWIDLTPCGGFGNGTFIEQTLALTPGARYSVSFDLGSWCGWDLSDSGIDVFINGVQLGSRLFNNTFDCSGTGPVVWQRMTTIGFTATGSTTIRLVGNGHCSAFSPTSGTYACNPLGGTGNPGVMALDNVNLNPLCAFNGTISGINPRCNGTSNGSASTTVTGASGAVSYAWNTGATTSSITGLNASTYIVTITDAGSAGATTITHYAQDFEGVHNWTLNTITGAEGADPNFWMVSDDEGGVLPPGCGVGTNGNKTLYITSVFNPTGGAAYDAGGLCGLLFCPQADRRAESPVFSTVGFSNVSVTFDFIGNGDALNDNASLYYSDNGGTSWQLLAASLKSPVCGGGQGQWTAFTPTALPASCNNNANVRIAVRWVNNDDGAGTDPSIAINNVRVFSVTPGGSPCSDVFAVTLTNPALVAISNAGTNPTAGNNGSVNQTPSGGTPGYTFLWNTGATTEDLTGLGAGTYTVTTTDANGCSMTASTLLSPPSACGITVTTDAITNTTCNGGSNGGVQITATAANTPLTFVWSNTAASTNEDIAGLPAGSYSVTITDNTGCSDVFAGFVVTQPTLLNVPQNNIAVTNVDCAGNNNGSVFTTPTGGTPGYTYLWSNGATTNNIANLIAGTYVLTVTDANGCTISTSPNVVGQPTAVVVQVTSQIPTCHGFSNGQIDATVTGGIPGFTYLWSNGATTAHLQGLPAGTYNLTLTDANGCSPFINPIVVTDPAAVTISSVSITDISCRGEIDITTNGGTPAYTFLWSTAATTQDVTGLSAGNYSVVIRDANNCIYAASFTLSNAAPMNLAVTPAVDTLDCALNPVGMLTATPSGGTAPINYVWSNGTTGDMAMNLSDAVYGVTATDAIGCTATAFGSVVAPFVPTLNAFVDNAGTSSTTISLGASVALNVGNNQTGNGVSYAWSSVPASGGIVDVSGAATSATPVLDTIYTYMVTATATSGCTDVDTVFVTVQGTVIIPTAFTPNNDGQNDVFRPLQIDPANVISFRVYNRWGQLLYNAANLTGGGWDGNFNGSEQPRDVYIYTLEYKKTTEPNPINLRGEFTLVR